MLINISRRGGASYRISIRDIPYVAQKALLPFLRGASWSILTGRGYVGLFLGPRVKFISAYRLKLGRAVSLGSDSYIECHAHAGVLIGNASTLRERAWIQCRSGLNEPGHGLIIGKNVYIGPGAIIGVGGAVLIDDGCQIGSGLTISAESHVIANGSFVTGATSRKGVRLGKECWLGNNVTILDGVTLGDRCVVGAGAVVTRDIPAGRVASGVPARVHAVKR